MISPDNDEIVPQGIFVWSLPDVLKRERNSHCKEAGIRCIQLSVKEKN